MSFVTPTGRPQAKTLIAIIGVPLLLIATLPALKFDSGRAPTMLGNLGSFIHRLFQSPDPKFLPTLVSLLGESFLIAFSASVVAIALSFPLSLLAARNSTPHPAVGAIVRGIASFLRAIPDLILALLLASAVGIGNVPGVIALSVAGLGFLLKAYAEALEVVGQGPIEGLTASGASPFAVRWLGIVPQAIPDLVGLSLYQMDVNLRSAAILGAVGAGGIGYELTQAVRLFRFDRIGVIILGIYLSVAAVDALSGWVRRKLA